MAEALCEPKEVAEGLLTRGITLQSCGRRIEGRALLVHCVTYALEHELK